MGLAESRASEYEKRVERSPARCGGYVLSGGYAHLVAFADHHVGEIVGGVEPGVYLDLVWQSGIHEGARPVGRAGHHRDGRVFRSRHRLSGNPHGRLVADGAEGIDQLGIRAYDSLERPAQHVKERGLDIFAEPVRRNLHRELGILQGHRADRTEPGVVLTRLHDLADNLQAGIPNLYVLLLLAVHCHW